MFDAAGFLYDLRIVHYRQEVGRDGCGYCFVTFATPEAAQRAMDYFQDFGGPQWPKPERKADHRGWASDKIMNTVWAKRQSFCENWEYWQGSEIWYQPEEYHPMLFQGGLRVQWEIPMMPVCSDDSRSSDDY